MKKEQVMSLTLRGYDQKRDKMLSELGLRGVNLRQLEDHSPDELQLETKAAVEQLRRQYKLFQAASQVARDTLEINLRGIKLVRDGGFLVTCSCSHFMEPELFAKTIREAAAGAHRRLRQVEFRTQSADHPILWAAEQSYYLKLYVFQVVIER